MEGSSGEAHGVLDREKLLVRLDAGSVSADHYYGVNGDLRRFDTSGTTYNRIFVHPSARYGLGGRFDVSLALPYTYERLTSTERFPERSIARLASVDLGAGWTALNTRSESNAINLAVRGSLSIPTGFHNGIYDDPEHPSFFDDGAMEGELGFAGVYATSEIQLGLKTGYRMRGEELEDVIPWSLGLDMTRIEGAAIGVSAFGVFSAKDPSQPGHEFYAGTSTSEQSAIDGGRGILRRPDRESYVAIRAGASVDIGDMWNLAAHYAVRLAGTNSFGLSGAWLTLGYRMK